MTTCRGDRVPIVQGRNRWIIGRTDRDGVNPAEVVQTTGAVLSRWLGAASPSGTRSAFEVIQDPDPAEGLGEFIIGAARPIIVREVGRTWPLGAMQGGKLLGRSIDCKRVRLLRADRPWYVVVDFDWRAPATAIRWPDRYVNAIGWASQSDPTTATQLDWMLLEARALGPAQRPDTTLGDEIADAAAKKTREAVAEIEELAGKGAKTAGAVLAIAAGMLVLYGWSNRGGSR